MKRHAQVNDRRTVRGVAKQTSKNWNLLSPQALVLLSIARSPDIRLCDLARAVGITERSAFQHVVDLSAAGVIERIKTGRRNRYIVNGVAPLGKLCTGTVADLVQAIG